MRAPECGVANPVRARTVAPRAQTRVITNKPFGNPPKAVSRFAECIPAPKSAGCGKGASFERSEGTLKTLSFAGKKSRKRGEWAFHYVQTNFSSGYKELSLSAHRNSNGKPITLYTHNTPIKCPLPPQKRPPKRAAAFLTLILALLLPHPAPTPSKYSPHGRRRRCASRSRLPRCGCRR